MRGIKTPRPAVAGWGVWEKSDIRKLPMAAQEEEKADPSEQGCGWLWDDANIRGACADANFIEGIEIGQVLETQRSYAALIGDDAFGY